LLVDHFIDCASSEKAAAVRHVGRHRLFSSLAVLFADQFSGGTASVLDARDRMGLSDALINRSSSPAIDEPRR
jgi:hypothetical protein